MPRFRQTAELLKLMGEKEQIRNLGVIAHIDHGKTTLTDSLLAGAGLLSSIGESYHCLKSDVKKVMYSIDAANYAFDVTPARFITGLITERGICRAQKEDVLRLYPEKRSNQF